VFVFGNKGFAIAFCEGKMQLVGTESVISFFPSVLEYIHALIQCGKKKLNYYIWLQSTAQEKNGCIPSN